jgi:hypothetical protein
MQIILFFSDNKQQSKIRQILINNPNIEFHENPSCGSSAVQCGNKEGHANANSCFS